MTTAFDEAIDEPPEDAEDYELSVDDVMTDGYVSVTEDTKINEAIDEFQRYAPDDPEKTTVYYT